VVAKEKSICETDAILAKEKMMRCLKPMYIPVADVLNYPHGRRIPCGQCAACRIQRRKEWSLRLWHERSYWDRSVFVTLTYAEDHLPLCKKGIPEGYTGTLVKEDLQKFFKRLRRVVRKPIKYYACGEYGDSTQRPHYHALIFGLGMSERERVQVCDA